MNDLFDAFLRPPCRSDKEVIVTNPHTGVELRVGIRSGLEVVERILNDPTTEDYRRTLWNAGLRSRRPDGHGYLIIGRGRVMVPVNAEDPGPFSFGDDREWDPIVEDRVYILNAEARAHYAGVDPDDKEYEDIMSCNRQLMLPRADQPLEDWGPGWERALDSELLNADHTARVAEWLVRHAASCLRLIPEMQEIVEKLEAFVVPEWNDEARKAVASLISEATEAARKRASSAAERVDDLYGRRWSTRHVSTPEVAKWSAAARKRTRGRIERIAASLAFAKCGLIAEVIWREELPRLDALVDAVAEFVGRLYEEDDLGDDTPFMEVWNAAAKKADDLCGELMTAVEVVKTGLRNK